MTTEEKQISYEFGENSYLDENQKTNLLDEAKRRGYDENIIIHIIRIMIQRRKQFRMQNFIKAG